MENESGSTTHEIEGIGSIRAHNGTALETIAGAAKHWETEAKRLKAEHEAFQYADTEALRKKWRDGFLTGSVSIATIGVVVGALLHLFS